jgi:hypothetical protein
MINDDRVIVARIIELVPLYDANTMPEQASTIPGDDGWGYTLSNFVLDHLEDDFPNIAPEQFNRCYFQTFEQTNQWRDLPGRVAITNAA